MAHKSTPFPVYHARRGPAVGQAVILGRFAYFVPLDQAAVVPLAAERLTLCDKPLPEALAGDIRQFVSTVLQA